ncbi:MAG TPA: hypothetical protein VFA21_15740 [Pyrinomonadaceae bacterium]|nr:hypothetical protein [Pyrinomonadaceae bacterium]
MATTKKTGSTKSAASNKATAADLNSTTKAVQQAVARALQAKQVQPKIRGPIFVGIIYDPIAKQFRVVNQFE